MAIGGNGFFTLINPRSGQEIYSRNGQFTFDKEGFLSTERGMRVQAIEVDRNTKESKGLPGSLKVLGLVDPPQVQEMELTVPEFGYQQIWTQMQ